MRVSRFVCEPMSDKLFTQPDQAFTPRQIIEQFSRGELSCKTFEPTDNIDDSNYPEETLVDGVIEFEDEFEAATFLKQQKIVRDEKKKSDSKTDQEYSGQTKDESSSKERASEDK